MKTRGFFSNIPKWGGKLIKSNFKKPVKLLNTCAIDYFLLALWTSSKLSKNILINLKNSEIKEKIASIIGFIDSNNWNKAKSIWLLDVCKIFVSQDENGNHSICTFGTEMELFINFIKPIQSFESQVVCNNQLCMRSSTINDLYFSKVGEDVVLNFFLKEKCSYCSHQLSISNNFNGVPPYHFIESDIRDKLNVHQLPNEISFGEGKMYKFICTTYCKRQHFRSIFNIKSKIYLVDDLCPQKHDLDIPNHHISICVYYLV